MEVADYGAPVDADARVAAITNFLSQMRTAISPTGAFLGADVIGIILWDESDNGIGQDLDKIVPLVDVVMSDDLPITFFSRNLRLRLSQ